MKAFLKRLLEHKLLDSAVLIGLLTVLSYFVTYLYESEYLEYYNVGPGSAQIELVPVIANCFLIFTVSIVSGGLIYFIYRNLSQELKPWKLLAKSYVLLGAMTLLLVLPMFYVSDPQNFLGNLRNQILNFVGILVIIIFLSFPAAFLSKKGIVNLGQSSLAFMLRVLKVTSFMMIAAMIFFYTSFFAVTHAYNRTKFKVVTLEKQKVLIVREYRNRMIGVAYDVKYNTVKNKYFYINTDQDEPLEYEIINKRIDYDSDLLKQSRLAQRNDPYNKLNIVNLYHLVRRDK